MLTPNEIDALIQLITFHDDWDEVSEHVGVDVNQLFDKLHVMYSHAVEG